MKKTRIWRIVLILSLAGTSAWADVQVQFIGTTTGAFVPPGAQGPLQFTGGSFNTTIPPDNGLLSNLGTFEIDRSALTCSGNNCYVENWNLDPVSFTLTFHFTLPTVNGIEDYLASVGGTIRKNGNSSNFNVNDVTIDFDNSPHSFTFLDGTTNKSFDLTVFDPPIMDLTLNPANTSVTTTVTGQISNIQTVSVVTEAVPEGSSPAFLAFNLLMLPGLLFLGRRRIFRGDVKPRS